MARFLVVGLLCGLAACKQAGESKPNEDVPVDSQGIGGDGDVDGDGYSDSDGDCNDGDAAIHPGATEICNELDDNCDGQVDEGVQQTWYQDADGDRYGDVATATSACEAPAGFLGDATDCNDTDAATYPGAPESCTDTTDRNCDGFPGATDADGDGVTACEDCNDGDARISPLATEICDANLSDEDCDGLADDADPSVDPTGFVLAYTDADADGYGDASNGPSCHPSGVPVGGDCNDQDPAYNPGASESCTDPADYNCDGSVGYTDGDADGFAACEECDDGNAAVNPSAVEACNGYDDDCNGQIDESGGGSTWYADSDGDGFGDAGHSQIACAAPVGFVANANDCADADAAVFPGAAESCNGVDDNCDGTVDEAGALGEQSWYADADSDGYGDDSVVTSACTAPAGTAALGGDCDDSDASVQPSAQELCNNVDDNCDGVVDEPGAGGEQSWYTDADGDGYGEDSSLSSSCTLPTGAVTVGGDCDDNNAGISPGAVEFCDGVDEDCNGLVDDGATDALAWYVDNDSDQYGDAASTVYACVAPAGYVAIAGDCDDSDANLSPAADELCNGLDDNCDGLTDDGSALDASTSYADQDGDSYGDAGQSLQACTRPSGYVSNADDCNDADAQVYPGAPETCNGSDDDCDGQVDEAGATGGQSWYADADGDSFGDAAVVMQSCTQPAGYVAGASDCDDTNGAIFPGATEACNGSDDDCDGQVDEAGATGESTWYRDADADSYGNAAVSMQACTQPSGYVSNALDCDDSSSSVGSGSDTDLDGTYDCFDTDDDNDGLSDSDEIAGLPSGFETDPLDADTDGDGTNDAADAAPLTAACHTTLLAYDDFTVNPTGNGWTVVSGTWSWNGVDDWTNSSSTAGANSWTGPQTWTNYVVEARMKLTTNANDAGLMARTRAVSAVNNGGQQYYLGLYPAANQVTLGYMNGTWNTIASGAVTIDPNIWYTVQLRMAGTSFQAYIDGTRVINTTSSTYSSGGIGFRTYYSPATYDYILACQ
jgi:large repetitive protein